MPRLLSPFADTGADCLVGFASGVNPAHIFVMVWDRMFQVLGIPMGHGEVTLNSQCLGSVDDLASYGVLRDSG